MTQPAPVDNLLKARILLGVLIAVAGTALFSFSQLEPDATIAARLLREGTIWLLLAMVLFYALRVEKLPAATIGLQGSDWKGTILRGLAAGFFLTLVAGAAVYVAKTFFHLETNNHLVAMLAGMPIWMIVMLSLRAGFTEEIIFRGYLLNRLGKLSGSHWFGVVGSVALFTLMHFGGWQAAQLLLVAIAGILFTALYLWKRNVMICVIAHTLVDLFGGLVVMGSIRS